MTDATATQLILLLTTIAGFVVTAWRENRTRQWAAADRRAATTEIIEKAQAEAEATRIKTSVLAESLRLEGLRVALDLREAALATADALRVKTEATATAIHAHSVAEAALTRQAQEHATATMLAKLDETKGAADAAYKEANHVNVKIENLNDRLLKQGEKQDGLAVETGKVIDHIDARGSDTNVRVRAIEHHTVKPEGTP